MSLKDLDYSVLQQCIHCGMCLPTCPTYDATKKETSSPRGRIALMRAVADEKLQISPSFAKEMYFCLGCLACETACPAGVKYHELIETARAESELQGVLESPGRNLLRGFFLRWLFVSRPRLRFLARILHWFQATGLQSAFRRLGLFHLLPKSLRDLEALTPKISSSFTRLGKIHKGHGPRVGLLIGCVQDIAFAEVHQDTLFVLEQNGCEVVLPAKQECCGSLHAHHGDLETARVLARKNLDAFDVQNLDAILINAAGCGAHMKHYGNLLCNDPSYAAKAAAWSHKVRDISEFLIDIGYRKPSSTSAAQRTPLVYHEACHLVHAQKVSSQPREILESLPDFECLELSEATWCCGSAGIYNITHPETASELLHRKISHIARSGALVVASANPGCTLQIIAGLRDRGLQIAVEHPISLLAKAYRKG